MQNEKKRAVTLILFLFKEFYLKIFCYGIQKSAYDIGGYRGGNMRNFILNSEKQIFWIFNKKTGIKRISFFFEIL